MKDQCPLCDGELRSLLHTKDHKMSGFHKRCDLCDHGWYIADLKTFKAHRLRGKTKEEVREMILKETE